MEHEVFVAVPADRLREALADPVRVAHAIPGLQQDAGSGPVAGRLKVRVAGHSITYRGAVRVAARDDGSYVVEGDATEARGAGSVKLALTLRLREAEGGTTVVFGGTATADGRVTELPPEAVSAAATRLLNRFAEQLAAEREPSGAAEPNESAPEPHGAAEPQHTAPEDTTPEPDRDRDREREREREREQKPKPEPEREPDREPGPDRDADATAPAPAPEDRPTPAPDQSPRDFPAAPEPPAEAAHARRTMIGRSAEEVDHAPPRGRYAPVPAPQNVVGNATLRWVAPAAALALASAIVVGRMLRRRR